MNEGKHLQTLFTTHFYFILFFMHLRCIAIFVHFFPPSSFSCNSVPTLNEFLANFLVIGSSCLRIFFKKFFKFFSFKLFLRINKNWQKSRSEWVRPMLGTTSGAYYWIRYDRILSCLLLFLVFCLWKELTRSIYTPFHISKMFFFKEWK